MVKTKRSTILLLCCVLFMSANAAKKESMKNLINDRLHRATELSLAMAESLNDQPTLLPCSLNKSGKLTTIKYNDWVSGFFPGVLWYLYEYNGDAKVLEAAKNYTSRLEGVKNIRYTHDLGFMLYCSYGNGLRLTGDTAYQNNMLVGAESLASRYNPRLGLIRSWDFNKDKWQYPVIIDNMMNLEFMIWASKASGNPKYREIAISHADKTLAHHFRPDYSSYHVVTYDTISGLPHHKQTHQGYADYSAWARGQGWGLYGFTVLYRETNDPKYLELAKHIADFILNHPNLPADKIPYWDFDAPDIPTAKRDASAGSLIASALIELSDYVDKRSAKKYLAVAEKQIRTLSSPEYFAELGTNGNFILKHSVGNYPGNSQIDVPLTYADYYYVEALLRYKNKFKLK